ncbi:MAG: hypothetical protein H5T62_04945 [Anaerolineae bacterium]|nr:hypothetical protein [Anaerolineae bacterium]
MSPEKNRRNPLWRWGLTLLALVVPLLVGYVVYLQQRMPVLDFKLDGYTGRVLFVPQDSFADWAGLQAGDVILTVDGVPFSEWRDPAVGNYPMEIERAGQRLTLELPLVPLVKVNLAPLISGVVVALVFWGTGTLLLWRRFWQEDVRILFSLAQVFAVATLLLLAHPSGTRPRWMTLLTIACFHLAAPLLLHHTLSFPMPLGSPAQRRLGLSLVYGLALVMLVGTLLWEEPWVRLGVLYTTLEVIAAIGVLLYAYTRRATPDGRRRLRLIVFGNLLAGVPALSLYLLPSIVGSSYRMPGWMIGLFLIIAPLSYLYATMRHNLFGIDRLLNRALVYALLSLGILFLYLGPFVIIYRFLPGDALLQTMVAAGITLLVGLSFDWVRARIQQVVDRASYGGWYDYASVVETVSDALARTLDRDRLNEVLTRQVPTMMHLHPARLQIGEPTGFQAHMRPLTPSTMQFKLTFQGQTRALWTVGPRRDGDDLTVTDRRILQTLARQAEVALSNVLLVETLRRQLEEIRAMQRQLLRSREEERARLARDLHDDPVQSLVALNLQLGLLLAQAEPSPSPLVETLKAIRAQVRELLTSLRQVCAELRPPMLDALGLGAALRALVDDWTAQSGVPVQADLSPNEALRSLPEEVSVNLYRVVQEALTNIARHAGAQQVTLRLAWEDSRLTLTLHDDGQGFSVPDTLHHLAAEGHFGLVGVQERVNLIGGTLAMESAPGRGTTVRVVWDSPTR